MLFDSIGVFVVRGMCNLRFSAKEQGFRVKVRFRIGKIASVSKKQFLVAIPQKNTNF